VKSTILNIHLIGYVYGDPFLTNFNPRFTNVSRLLFTVMLRGYEISSCTFSASGLVQTALMNRITFENLVKVEGLNLCSFQEKPNCTLSYWQMLLKRRRM
jgi:hypothetical protein